VTRKSRFAREKPGATSNIVVAAAYETSLARLQIEAPRTADLRAPASGRHLAHRACSANPMDAENGWKGTPWAECSLYPALRPGLNDSPCPVGINRLIKTLVAQRIGRKLPSECSQVAELSPDALVRRCPDGTEPVINIIGAASGDRVEVPRNAISVN
jgi:hypothetical protein